MCVSFIYYNTISGMKLSLNSLSEYLISIFEKKQAFSSREGMQVNPIVSEIATLYEKFRNAIDYREEEVILRTTIERILRRRLLLGGRGKNIARPLVRELLWARYFPGRTVSEENIQKIEETIDVYLDLRKQLIGEFGFRDSEANEWIYELMSCEIEDVVAPSPEKEGMISYIFHILKQNITISDDTEETRDAQVFIAVRRAYAKNDRALLRHSLFKQYYEEVGKSDVTRVASSFREFTQEVEKQLSYPLRHKIHAHIKKHIPPFLILDDILFTYRGEVRSLFNDTEEFARVVFATCEARYKGILTKVRRAIVRSVIFILISKAFFAFAIEGTYENIVYGHILWGTLVINIAVPVMLMGLSSLFIRVPGRKNTERIYTRILTVLSEEEPRLGRDIILKKVQTKNTSTIDVVFTFSWITTFIVSFGIVIFILTKLNFNPVSQAFFVFFLAIVSFLIYRINQTAHKYTVEDKQNLLTPVIDFFFLPIAKVGQRLTEGISQINIFLFLFDLVIEAPFKGLFAFFDQWFLFLHAKREDLE